MSGIFKIKNVKYNFRNIFAFVTKNARSVRYGWETDPILPKNSKYSKNVKRATKLYFHALLVRGHYFIQYVGMYFLLILLKI